MSQEYFKSPKKKGKLAAFLSGRGSNFVAIHDAILEGKINAEVALVFSDKKDAPGLKIAKERNLDTLSLNPKDFNSKEDYEQEIIREVKKRKIDLICLAGYMRILSPHFCRQFPNAILNIHPALLPAFPGLHVQRKALEWGVRYSGATVHFVTPDVDMGPIVLQAVVPVKQDDTEEALSQRILKEEHRIYPEAIKLYFEGRLEIRNRHVYIK